MRIRVPVIISLLTLSVACGGATEPAKTPAPTTPDKPASTAQAPNSDYGLVLARSVFNEGPSPATMLILQPGADGWSRTEVAVPGDKIEVQPGLGPDGELFVRSIEGGSPQKPELTDGTWSLVDAAEAPEIEWLMDEKKGGPMKKSYELAGGNVFHKCMWFEPAFGEPGILTISANMPYLQIWREADGQWTAETLWTSLVGGREHRFRDIEPGDVDGDGQDELVLVTHDMGAVYVLEQTEEGLQAQEIHRSEERTFVHEVEIGDVDGDGLPEFFTTPSEPNRLDGTEQGGGIDMYRFNADDGAYVRTEVARFPDRHAKEILAVDYDGDGTSELYAALESEGMSDPTTVLTLRGWSWQDGALAETGDVPLGGEMCRFLNVGDTDGDGVREIIASTRKQGIWVAEKKDGEWAATNAISGSDSGGFEHATVVIDSDGDGKDELFVASDTQKKLQLFRHEGDAFVAQELIDFEGDRYFVWNIMPIPAKN